MQITGITVTDITLDQLITLNDTTGNPVTSLDPGANATGTYNYTTSQTDVDNGSVVNIAYVNSTAGCGCGPANNSRNIHYTQYKVHL